MPGRQQVSMACQHCRKKRAKCDGEDPCDRCSKAGRQCLFSSTRRQSKDALRAEIERLRRSNEQDNALLDALSCTHDAETYGMVARSLLDRTVSRQAIARELAVRARSRPGREPAGDPTLSPPAASAQPAVIAVPAPCRYCNGRFPSPTSVDSAGGDHGLSPAESSDSSSVFSPPELPSVDADSHVNWTVTYIRQLVDSLADLDPLPFCLLCKNLFLENLAAGGTCYSSPALVKALVALARRTVHGTGSEAFDKAETLVRGADASGSLPNIQALGIISLYQLSCGREAEARELAEGFAAAVTRLRLLSPSTDGHGKQYGRVLAMSYCGAVTLVRILLLTTLRPSSASDDRMHDDGILLDAESLFMSDNCPYSTPTEQQPTLGGPQVMAAKIYQLSERVYKFLVSRRPDASQDDDSRWNEVMAAYRECLGWYERLFALPRMNVNSSPLVLCVHIYYQFCLLCLFRPLVARGMGDNDVWAREICLQATGSILMLTESYAAVFGLRHVSPLITYFVLASGLLSLEVEKPEGGMMDSISVRSEVSLAPNVVANPNDEASPTPSVMMPTVAQARPLLAEMSETHPAAAMAECMLRTVFPK